MFSILDRFWKSIIKIVKTNVVHIRLFFKRVYNEKRLQKGIALLQTRTCIKL